MRALVARPRRIPGAPAWVGVLARAAALGAVYAAIYKLIALETSFGTSVGSTFWPASGVTVSMLLLRPRREWPFLPFPFCADYASYAISDHCHRRSGGVR